MAQLGTTRAMDKPMSVEQIVATANELQFDTYYAPRNWFRSAEVLLKQAGVYEHEGQLQTAYLLLYRHARLIIDLLPSHPDAKDPKYRQAWIAARKSVGRSLAKMELLKPRINERFEKYQQRLKAHNDHVKKDDSASRTSENDQSTVSSKLDPLEHTDLAVELANKSMAGMLRRSDSLEENESNELGTAMREARRRIDHTDAIRAQRTHTTPEDHGHSYHYPHMSGGQFRNIASTTGPRLPPKTPQVPVIPPKTGLNIASAPAIPSKEPIQSQHGLLSSPQRPETPTDVHQFSASSELESGAPLRTVFLPSNLRTSFLNLAQQNTSRNLETLGLLCGNLLHNALFINTLLIPPQTATSDTCEMTDAGEAALDAYISEHSAPDLLSPDDPDYKPADKTTSPSNDLLVLGWIHTHPSQTCFMSSRDLHTHVWYQASLPESIAVVCAPRQPSPQDWGVFRLTDPPGMPAVRACRKQGIFHPHDEVSGAIYTDACGRPGHVIEAQTLRFEVVDLRDAPT